MDPVSMTLGWVVARLVAAAVDRTADRAVDDGERFLGGLLGKLRERFSRDADGEAATALDRLEDAPDSPSRVEALAELLDTRAERIDGFRVVLEELVAEARSAGVNVDQITQTAIGNQIVQNAGVVGSSINVSYDSSPRL